MATSTVSVSVPLDTAPKGFISLDLQDLPLKGSYADLWRQYIQGHRTAGTTLADGTLVVTSRHALIWLIQQMGATGQP